MKSQIRSINFSLEPWERGQKSLNISSIFYFFEKGSGSILTHLTPKNGTGKEIGKSLYKAVVKVDAVETVGVIGNDGCSGNNGADNGACACFECYIGKLGMVWNCIAKT